MSNTKQAERVGKFLVSVQSEGVNFGCRGIVKLRGKVVAETRLYPHDMRAAAMEAAMDRAAALNAETN